MYYNEELGKNILSRNITQRFVVVENMRIETFEKNMNQLIKENVLSIDVVGFTRTYEFVTALVLVEEVNGTV